MGGERGDGVKEEKVRGAMTIFKEPQSIQAICTSSSKLHEVYISPEVKTGLGHNNLLLL